MTCESHIDHGFFAITIAAALAKPRNHPCLSAGRHKRHCSQKGIFRDFAMIFFTSENRWKTGGGSTPREASKVCVGPSGLNSWKDGDSKHCSKDSRFWVWGKTNQTKQCKETTVVPKALSPFESIPSTLQCYPGCPKLAIPHPLPLLKKKTGLLRSSLSQTGASFQSDSLGPQSEAPHAPEQPYPQRWCQGLHRGQPPGFAASLLRCLAESWGRRLRRIRPFGLSVSTSQCLLPINWCSWPGLSWFIQRKRGEVVVFQTPLTHKASLGGTSSPSLRLEQHYTLHKIN